MNIREIYDELTRIVEENENPTPKDYELPSNWTRRLSDRQIQVLQLVAEGLSNVEIGVELNISALTVKSHLQNISEIMGTGSREVMVLQALRAGAIK